MLNTHSYDKCMQQGYSESLYSGLCCFSFVHFSLKSTQLLEVLTQWMIYVIWANLDLPIFGTLDTRVFYCIIPINSSILTTNSAYPNPSTPSDLSRYLCLLWTFFSTAIILLLQGMIFESPPWLFLLYCLLFSLYSHLTSVESVFLVSLSFIFSFPVHSCYPLAALCLSICTVANLWCSLNFSFSSLQCILQTHAYA